MTVPLTPATEIDFSEWVRPGDLVAWTQGAGEPVALVERLLEQRHTIGPFRALLGTSYSGLVTAEHADVISFLGFGVVGAGKSLAAAGSMDIVPVNLSEVPRLLRSGRIAVDVLILQVSDRGDGAGYSLGAVNGYVHEALAHARTVLVEVNTTAPWTYSRTVIDKSAVTMAFESTTPLVEVRERPPTDIDTVIARQIADLVPDGATLQLGIGGVPAAVSAFLTDRRHLGLHSGVIGDSVLALLRQGVIDNSCKPVDRGVSVTGLLTGSHDLYDFAHQNRAVRVEPVTYTHDPVVLQSLPSLVAVNSALEVDLMGQIGSEVVGTSFVGIIGGQADFARGALASEGGRSIIGLPSRVGTTSRPRIVPLLRSGIVSTPRSDADVIVTEFGTAYLRGASVRERVAQMIAIAHPDDREALDREAQQLIAGY
ncbi:acetyl-CoA hydrolase/transferase family protein [Rhodococcus erythropolis]|uniref:acetyl-CoA hydrolase/transferase family protein n=1 Tax=Rhodococcus erythropolis TaxID=1833 RepID=UPI003013FCA5